MIIWNQFAGAIASIKFRIIFYQAHADLRISWLVVMHKYIIFSGQLLISHPSVLVALQLPQTCATNWNCMSAKVPLSGVLSYYYWGSNSHAMADYCRADWKHRSSLNSCALTESPLAPAISNWCRRIVCTNSSQSARAPLSSEAATAKHKPASPILALEVEWRFQSCFYKPPCHQSMLERSHDPSYRQSYAHCLILCPVRGAYHTICCLVSPGYQVAIAGQCSCSCLKHRSHWHRQQISSATRIGNQRWRKSKSIDSRLMPVIE